MKRKSDRLRKTINFGEKGDVVTTIVKEIEQKTGNKGLSQTIRELLLTTYSSKPEFKQIQIKTILSRRKIIQKKMFEYNKELLKTEDELNRLGHELQIGE